MDMWNKPLTRENISEFYDETVFMAYSSVLQLTKETTRAETAIIKSYADVFQQRTSINGEDVIYVFGDLLLQNTNDIIERSPVPDNIDFSNRSLDEFTRNSMLESILRKIDSKLYKATEMMSSDSRKSKSDRSTPRIMDMLPVTPALVIQLVFLAIVIWLVSYAAVTIINRKNPLLDSNSLYSSDSLQEEYVSILPYYPLDANFPVTDHSVADQGDDSNQVSESTESPLGPVIGTTEVSATRG